MAQRNATDRNISALISVHVAIMTSVGVTAVVGAWGVVLGGDVKSV